MAPAVRFERVSRRFGEVRAVDEVSFEVEDGEFFAMLGPSGSGKTTCLRLIAGFEEPDAGGIAIHGRAMAGVPPYDRNVNTVFQDYALFPHMSVQDNVAYGLRVRGVGKIERRAQAQAMLDLVALGGLGARRPAELSGGQRQRVALARALINRPEVLLLDEPLGALDLKLRQQMQTELKALQRKVGITFVYVTHDQEEALGMSDRLAVFNHGRIEQIGTPRGGLRASGDRLRRGLRRRLQHRRCGDRGAPGRPKRGIRAAPGAHPDPRAGRRRCRAQRSGQHRRHPVPWRQHPDRRRPRRRRAVERRATERRDRRPPTPDRRPHPSRLGRERDAALRGRHPVSTGIAELAPAMTPRSTASRRLSTLLYRRAGLFTLLLLTPPLLWLGVIYLGSLFALLIQSFFAFDDFTGQVVYRLTLRSYVDLLTSPANLDIILRTVTMAAAVTVGAALIGFPIAYMMARYAAGRARALFYLAVMLPLWSSYLVRVYAWKLILAKEGIVSWVFARTGLTWLLDGVLALPVIGGPSLSVSYLGMFLVFTYIWLPFMILPVQAALERVPAPVIEAAADLGARPFTAFRTVILPLAFPGVVAGSIFTFSLTLGDYIIPYIIGSSRFFIGQAVYLQQGTAGNIPLAAAFSVVPIVIMAVYLTLAKRLGAFDAL